MMNYSSSRILTSMHPSIRHLNIRNVAKIVASKIICNTQLQLQYNPDFCRQLGVSTYLNTHIGLAYFQMSMLNCCMTFMSFQVISQISYDLGCDGVHRISKTNMQ